MKPIFSPVSFIGGSRAVDESLTHYFKRIGMRRFLEMMLFSPSERGILYKRRYGLLFIYDGLCLISSGLKQIILGRK